MELKSTDLLKVLQRAHEKEPAKVEEPYPPSIARAETEGRGDSGGEAECRVAPVVEEGHGGPVEEEHHEFRAAQQSFQFDPKP